MNLNMKEVIREEKKKCVVCTWEYKEYVGGNFM